MRGWAVGCCARVHALRGHAQRRACPTGFKALGRPGLACLISARLRRRPRVTTSLTHSSRVTFLSGRGHASAALSTRRRKGVSPLLSPGSTHTHTRVHAPSCRRQRRAADARRQVHSSAEPPPCTVRRILTRAKTFSPPPHRPTARRGRTLRPGSYAAGPTLSPTRNAACMQRDTVLGCSALSMSGGATMCLPLGAPPRSTTQTGVKM